MDLEGSNDTLNSNITMEETKIPQLKQKLSHILIKIEGRISKWRKKLKVNPDIDFFVAQPIRQADRFLKKLYSDDDFYRSARYAWVSPDTAKKLYLYGCARQVVKATMVLLQNKEHILEKPKKGSIDSMGRMILEGIIDEQNIIIRKHIELLANLLNFSRFNKDEAYRLFLNLENLEHFLSRQGDFKDFYESQSVNIQHSINDFLDRIKEDLKNLKVSETWFLKKDWEKKVESFAPPLLTSVRQRYKSALPFATDDERIMMGLSYSELFGDISVSAHASAGSRIRDHHYRFSTIKDNISAISILGQHIINRANQLMGFDDSEDLIKKMLEQGTSSASKLLQRDRKTFQPGDIVLAIGDLAEIVECKISKFGYSSCKVKFLTRAPLPDVPEDWMPTAFVISILPKSKVRAFMFQDKRYENLPQEVKDILEKIKQESDDKIIVYARGALVSMHNYGILIPALLQSGYLKQRDIDEEE